jgi:6-phosphofructokinase 1
VAYDLVYCGLLGMGVKRLFDAGHTACMVMADNIGNISPLFLSDVQDENGKIKPRLVNMESQRAKLIFEDGLQYINPGDWEDAKHYLDNPKYYDFREILNW